MSASNRIAIIGGGPSGLTAAFRLQRAGLSVVVFEAKERPGGRMRTDRPDGYEIDAGAQLFGSMFTAMRALVEELGMTDRLVRSAGRDALWRNGRAHEVIYGSMASMIASGGLSVRTKLRLGTTYLPFLSRNSAALDLHAPERAAAAMLDNESIEEWGERVMDLEFVESLVYPQLAAYYGALPQETSAGFYHILAHYGLDVSVFGFRGGASTFCETLAQHVGARGGEVRLKTPVDRVELHSDGVRVLAAGAQEEFDEVIMAVPAPVALKVLLNPSLELKEWLEAVRFRPAISLGLMLDRPVNAGYFGLSFPRGDAETVAAVCVEENKGVGLVPDGRGLLVVLVRPEIVPSLLESEPRRIFDAILPDLERAFPGVTSTVAKARVYRWPVGNPVFYPGYLARLGEFRRGVIEGNSPLALAGDYLYSSSVEGAVTAGEAAAARIIARVARA